MVVPFERPDIGPLDQTPDPYTGPAETPNYTRRKLLADGLQWIPVVYGRRRLPGVVIESSILQWGTTWQKVMFVVVSEGEIESIERWYLDGEEQEDQDDGTIKTQGIFYRAGETGTTDTETEAEYNSDYSTQKRDQNTDYRSVAAQPYSETAYVILVMPNDEDVDTLPSVAFDVKGMKVQKYTSGGSADGSPVWSENPVWQLVDLIASDKHGLGHGASIIDCSVAKPEADYCDEDRASTEASTTVRTAQATATTTCEVNSTEGFVVGRTIKVNGVSNTVAAIPGDKELTLGTAVAQSVGHTVVQYHQRFASNVVLQGEGDAARAIKQLLAAFRGYITHDAGKVQIRCERPLESVVTNGGLENWSSASDLDDWYEGTSGGTVNQDGTDPYAGTYCARLDHTGSGFHAIYQDGITLTPGAWYRFRVYSKASVVRTDGVRVLLRNTTQTMDLDSDGTWGAYTKYCVREDSTTAWTAFSLVFRVPSSYGASDSYYLYLYGHGMQAGDSIYYDATEIAGPIAGHFKDSGADDGYGIVEGSFRWETANTDRLVNRVAVRFLNDGSDVGRDEAVANDFSHQQTNRLKTKTIRAEAVADRDQAQRLADYHLAKARTLGTGASFRGGPGSVPVQPGDVILLTHTVPNWSGELCRVVKKSLPGLGDDLELHAELTVERYDETIYGDDGANQRGLPARPTPTLTLSTVHTTARMVQFAAALSDTGFSVYAYELHRSSTTGFAAAVENRVVRTRSSRIFYRPLDSEVGETMYFICRALTDRGAIESAELEVYIGGVAQDDMDATATQRTSNFNLVYDGDFSDASNWTAAAASATQDVFSGDNDQESGTTLPYSNPTDANNKSDATYANGSVISSGDTAGHEWHTFGTGVASGTLYVRHQESNADCAQTIKYTKDGSTWLTLGSSSTSWATSSATLTDVDLSKLRVRAHTEHVANFGGSGRVSQIYFVDDRGKALVDDGGSDIAELRGDYAGGESSIERTFPLQITVSTRKHFAPGSLLSVLISAQREATGVALDDDVVVYIEEVGGSWTQDLMTIPAADVGDDWADFASAAIPVDSSIPTAALRVGVRTGSTAGVQLDKLSITRGQVRFPFEPHPMEHDGSSGTIGDFSKGATSGGGGVGGGFDPGDFIKPPSP